MSLWPKAFVVFALSFFILFPWTQISNGFIVKQKIVKTENKVVQVKRTITLLADDPSKHCDKDQHTPLNYTTYLTSFRCGTITDYGNGTIIRHFLLIANDYGGIGKPIAISKNETDPLIFHSWSFNGSVPGPTLRMSQGEHIQINVTNSPESQFTHSFHMHSIHSAIMDGVTGMSGAIAPGKSWVFDFIAQPAGVYPYHCHVQPIEEHINRGLYGQMVIDPKIPRPAATEMVMMMNGFSYSTQGVYGNTTMIQQRSPTEQELKQNLSLALESADEAQFDNQVYAVNSMAFGYTGNQSIMLLTHKPYRIYLANMVEFDPVNSFHLHANMFTYTPSGTMNSSKIYTDIVTLGQGDRGILDFSIPYAGEYMFHAHINHFSDLGWMGFFNVVDSGNKTNVSMLKKMEMKQMH